LSSLEIQKKINDKKFNALSEKFQKIEIESKSFITKDALDISIEYALANPISFDFYIDAKGGASIKKAFLSFSHFYSLIN